MNTEARVNFKGITAYPRNDEDTKGLKFYSCTAPVRGHEKHDRLTIIANNDAELEELRNVGVVELSKLDTYEDEYENNEGETRQQLNTTIGSVMARGDW